MEDLPLGRISAFVPEFAVKDLPLGRTLKTMILILLLLYYTFLVFKKYTNVYLIKFVRVYLRYEYILWVNKICLYHYGADRLINYCTAALHEWIGAPFTRGPVKIKPDICSSNNHSVTITTSVQTLSAVIGLSPRVNEIVCIVMRRGKYKCLW